MSMVDAAHTYLECTFPAISRFPIFCSTCRVMKCWLIIAKIWYTSSKPNRYQNEQVGLLFVHFFCIHFMSLWMKRLSYCWFHLNLALRICISLNHCAWDLARVSLIFSPGKGPLCNVLPQRYSTQSLQQRSWVKEEHFSWPYCGRRDVFWCLVNIGLILYLGNVNCWLRSSQCFISDCMFG